MRATIVFIATAILSGWFTACAGAATRFSLDSGTPTAGAAEISRHQAGAQEVFLPNLFIYGSEPSELQITEIAPILYRRNAGGPNPIVTVWLSREIGDDARPVDVIGSWDIAVANTTPQTILIPTDVRTTGGRHFVVVSSDAEREDSGLWPRGNQIIGNKFLASQFNPDLPPEGNWNVFDLRDPGQTVGFSFGLRVDGRAVPEPSTFWTVLGCGAIGVLCTRRVRCKLQRQ